jgi:polar amino acid transport system substrate-binding protein
MLDFKQLFVCLTCFVANCSILRTLGYSEHLSAEEMQAHDQAIIHEEGHDESDRGTNNDVPSVNEGLLESDVSDVDPAVLEATPEPEVKVEPEATTESVPEERVGPEQNDEPQQEPEPQSQSKETTMPKGLSITGLALSAIKAEIAPELLNAAPDIMNIIARGELRVGICPVDQPPFHVKKENGEILGFDVDLANGIAESLKVKLKLVEASDWEQTITYLLEGKVDLVISNLTATPERASKIFCSVPYAKIRQCVLLNRVLVARAAGKDITTLRDIFSKFENHTIIAQKGTSYVPLASSLFPNAKLESTLLWKDIIARILSKEAMGTVSDELEIKEQLKSVKTVELLPVVLKKKYDRIVIGVSRSAPHLLHFVNNYIETNNVECNLEDF